MSANAPIASQTEPVVPDAEEQRDPGEVRKERVRSAFERYAIIVVFIVMIGVFAAINPTIFGTWLNAKNILAQTAELFCADARDLKCIAVQMQGMLIAAASVAKDHPVTIHPQPA